MATKTKNGTREIRSEPPTYAIMEDSGEGSDGSSIEGDAKFVERHDSEPGPRNFKKEDMFARSKSSASLPPVPLKNKDKDLRTAFEEQCWLQDNDVMAQKEVALGKRIGMYRLGKELGAGNFSKVKLGVHVLAKEKVAIKIMDKTKMDSKAQKLLAREIGAMEKTLHPNIIRLFECVETLTRMHLVMEYAGGGELYAFVHEKGKLPEEDTKIIFSQVVSAVSHLHSLNIVHRDIKAENIMFSGPGKVKLGDFGFSCVVEPMDQLSTFCGSPPYAAPELLRDKSYCGPAVDMWAMGVLLYFMLVGITPFKGETLQDLKDTIVTGVYVIPEYISPAATNLIKSLLNMDIEKRYEIVDVRRNLWLNGMQFKDSRISIAIPDEKELLEKKKSNERIWKMLHSWGITETMVMEADEKGPRHAVTGIYRIVQYQTELIRLKQSSLLAESQASSSVPSKKQKSIGYRSKTCTLL